MTSFEGAMRVSRPTCIMLHVVSSRRDCNPNGLSECISGQIFIVWNLIYGRAKTNRSPNNNDVSVLGRGPHTIEVVLNSGPMFVA